MDTGYGSTLYSTSSSAETLDPAMFAVLMSFVMIMVFFCLVVSAISIVSTWKLFTKANKPGWAAIVPIYNTIVMLEIVGRPMWWLIMFFISPVNIVFGVMLYIDLAKSYGKDAGWGVLTVFFPIVMLPIMAFNKTIQYVGPVGPESHTPPVAQAPMQ